ncbi:AA permease C-terminal domain-containing protein [Phytophthora infestans]|uniref:AA permease C-terminal domain-containing protein n=1 Tax=Phytophthora infestans TaxID=4787 RepID=A0A833TAT7_PHYIN|nr:AA permease C-terminal domain-containing protein [Phytophthora infestans]
MNALRLAFWRKPLHVETSSHSVQESDNAPEMERTLGLFDLIMIGIGGTVGSGVFATAGLIASSYAGPAATLSWLLAGIGCLLSGLSFMELACLIPSAGSTYAYAYHALGELPALIAGFLLTLEYGVSSAGGARSWSDKLTQWMDSQLGVQGPDWMKPKDSTIDLYAGLLMTGITAIVLCGMQAGKLVVNVVTMTKITVVMFIIVFGLANFSVDKISPFVPDQSVVEVHGKETVAFGWPGVLLGASASFYGYIGYDEVCCLAGEAKDPARNIPRAVVGTIIGAATLSILATFALVGMQKYTEIDAEESYGNAFTSVGMDWAASFVATGEVLTMPITSFIGFMAQPRVQYAMAKDGLLPAVFSKVDSKGNLFRGTLLCGTVVTLLAIFVPFHVLWNFISLGILVAFNLTNGSLLLVRVSGSSKTEGSDGKQSQGAMIAGYLVSSLVAAFHWQKGVVASVPLSATSDISLFDSYMRTVGPFVAALFTVIAIGLMFALSDAEKKQTVASAAAKEKSKEQNGAVEIVLTAKKQDNCKPGCRHRSRSLEDEEDGAREEDDEPKDNDRPLSTVASESDEDTIEPSSSNLDEEKEESTFRAPFVPFAPCVAIFFNWFLFAQMDGMSVLLILLWLLLAVVVYFSYSRHQSLAFQQTQYHQLAQQ